MGWITIALVVSFLVGMGVGAVVFRQMLGDPKQYGLLLANPGSPQWTTQPYCAGANIQFAVNPSPTSPAECVKIESILSGETLWRNQPVASGLLTHPFSGTSAATLTVRFTYALNPSEMSLSQSGIGPCLQSSSSSSSSRSSTSSSSSRSSGA